MSTHISPQPPTQSPASELQQPPTTAMSSAVRRKSLIATILGNLLEYYEWGIYAVMAPFIAAAMFNNENPASALLATFAVFAVGFLSRPIGGFVFGRIADRRGRRLVLMVTILIMSACSLTIGLLPSFGTIGVWSSALLLILRVIQGLAQGGEAGAATSYVSEIAPPHRRGLWSSFIFASMIGGSIIAYGISAGVTSFVSKSAMGEWGWRVPFILSGVIALYVIYLRRNLQESDVFKETNKASDPAAAGASKTPRTRGISKQVLLVVFLISGLTVAHYTWGSYMSTYAITTHGMDAGGAFWALMVAQIVSLGTIPLWGMLSDRIGRRPIWIGFAVVMFIIAIPMKSMVTDDPITLFIPATIVLILVCGPAAIMSATMSEAFPTSIRTTGVGFTYAFAIAAFGGSAPYLNALFLQRGVEMISSYYIMALCVATIIAALLMKETRNSDLRDA